MPNPTGYEALLAARDAAMEYEWCRRRLGADVLLSPVGRAAHDRLHALCREHGVIQFGKVRYCRSVDSFVRQVVLLERTMAGVWVDVHKARQTDRKPRTAEQQARRREQNRQWQRACRERCRGAS